MLSLAAALAMLAITPAPAPAAVAPARFEWFDYRGDDAQPKPGPGDYGNPILQGFYPDPSVVRVGNDYYLVNSTFSWFPGIPVFHSRDLVHWTQIGNAIDRSSQLKFDRTNMWLGVYAPDISWHDGTFYILNTCVGCGGNFVITARNPAGPWSDPAWLPEIDGIDTSLFFDDDGSAWIVNNGPPVGTPRYEGHRAIWIQQFDPKLLKLFGPRKVLVDSGVHPEQKPIWIEGPHIFRKDGAYYLMAAEGGTEEGHSEVIFRGDKVGGPYVPFAGNPILTQRDLPKDRPNPITSTGHAGLVELPNGDWWSVFLGVRPYDAQNNFNTGRETFLMPVQWKDGWPRITEPGQAVPWTHKRPNLSAGAAAVPTSGAFTVRDEFTRSGLPPYWMMLRNPDGKWWRIAHGELRLEPRSERLGELDNPSLLARRQQHLNAQATTRLRFEPRSDDAEAGMVALQNDEYWYFLAVGREGGKRVIRLRRRAGPQEPAAGVIVASNSISATAPVELRIAAHGGSYDFSWSPDGKRWNKLVDGADGTILSTKRSGGFVGAAFGLYAHAGAPQPQIAITIDDLPVHAPYPPGTDANEVNARMVAALKAAGVPATGFLNGATVDGKQGTIEALQGWRSNGFAIANHTWSHPHLSALTIPQFEQELTKNEPLLQSLGGESDWRWFRYPFLDEGKDQAQRMAAREVLASHGYRVAAVTIGFSDWAWTGPYARCMAKRDSAAVAELDRLYLRSARENIPAARDAARKLYGRDIPYVLLMHVSAMSARMMPQVIQLYRDAGFRFVSLAEAERDPAYIAYTDLRLPPPASLQELAKQKGVQLLQAPDYSARLDAMCA